MKKTMNGKHQWASSYEAVSYGIFSLLCNEDAAEKLMSELFSDKELEKLDNVSEDTSAWAQLCGDMLIKKFRTFTDATVYQELIRSLSYRVDDTSVLPLFGRSASIDIVNDKNHFNYRWIGMIASGDICAAIKEMVAVIKEK